MDGLVRCGIDLGAEQAARDVVDHRVALGLRRRAGQRRQEQIGDDFLIALLGGEQLADAIRWIPQAIVDGGAVT